MVNMQNKEKYILYAIVGVLIFYCVHLQLNNRSSNELAARLLSENDSLTIEKNSLGQEVSSQAENIMDLNKDLEKKALENSKLSKIKTHIEIQRIAQAENLVANYVDTNTITITDTNCVIKNRKFKFVDDWLKVVGTIKAKNVVLDTLSVFDKVTVNLGTENHFFRKNEHKVEVINQNPYFKTNRISNYSFKQNSSWYNNKWLYLGVGLVSGLVILK